MLKPNEIYFVGQVNQKALIRNGGKILLVQYSSNPKCHKNPSVWGKWDMPGGRLNEGEDVIAGLKREVLEEINLDIVVKNILTTGTFQNLGGIKNFFVIYGATLAHEKSDFTFNDGEVAAVRWCEPKDFFTLPILYPEYQEALKPILNI